jgi:hypothetical protein
LIALRPVLRDACGVADLDFFVDVVVGGTVLGVGLTDSPDDVARTLGGDFVEDRTRAAMRRDYGLVEFSWARRPGSDSWQATASLCRRIAWRASRSRRRSCIGTGRSTDGYGSGS